MSEFIDTAVSAEDLALPGDLLTSEENKKPQNERCQVSGGSEPEVRSAGLIGW